MLDIVVATNDADILENNLLRSPLLKSTAIGLHVQKGYSSAGRAYNDAMARCQHDIIAFAHQDVYIPRGWHLRVVAALKLLEKIDPAWAVLGLFGVTEFGRHVGYVWSSGLNTLLGKPFSKPQPVASVDELLIIFRKSSGIRFDEALPGYHLYGTDIVQTALSVGRGTYVICAPVIHNSRPVLYLPDEYLVAYDYEVLKWRERLPIANCVAPLTASRKTRWKMTARQMFGKIRNVHRNRASLDQHLDCVKTARALGLESA